MARITVEDCLDRVNNRFELVLIAARRARDLTLGKEAMVPWENDKPTVVALRELAEGKLDGMIKERQGRDREAPLFAEPEAEPEPAALDDAATDAD